jgi:hypothetical protein
MTWAVNAAIGVKKPIEVALRGFSGQIGLGVPLHALLNRLLTIRAANSAHLTGFAPGG